jgi:hypothetical protein
MPLESDYPFTMTPFYHEAIRIDGKTPVEIPHDRGLQYTVKKSNNENIAF